VPVTAEKPLNYEA